MRYTTTIDISEIRELYANKNIVLLYFHLCLKAGYHSDDRDIVSISVRKLASECGITYAAARHGIAMLAKHKLLELMPDYKMKVCKFVMPDIILPRPKRARQPMSENEMLHQEVIQRQDEEREKMYKEAKEGKRGIQALLVYLDEKAANGDVKAKKEAAQIRGQLSK